MEDPMDIDTPPLQIGLLVTERFPVSGKSRGSMVPLKRSRAATREGTEEEYAVTESQYKRHRGPGSALLALPEDIWLDRILPMALRDGNLEQMTVSKYYNAMATVNTRTLNIRPPTNIGMNSLNRFEALRSLSLEGQHNIRGEHLVSLRLLEHLEVVDCKLVNFYVLEFPSTELEAASVQTTGAHLRTSNPYMFSRDKIPDPAIRNLEALNGGAFPRLKSLRIIESEEEDANRWSDRDSSDFSWKLFPVLERVVIRSKYYFSNMPPKSNTLREVRGDIQLLFTKGSADALPSLTHLEMASPLSDEDYGLYARNMPLLELFAFRQMFLMGRIMDNPLPWPSLKKVYFNSASASDRQLPAIKSRFPDAQVEMKIRPGYDIYRPLEEVP